MPASDPPILILGGTKEAANIATLLVERGLNVTTSLAGRTREPSPLMGNVRVGSFGGAQGLSTYLKQNRITLLLDMTHPFAVNMSLNAQQAAELAGVKLIAWQRPAWQRTTHDNWQSVRSIEQAVTAIPANARVLLALGSQYIAPFAKRPDVHFLVRMVDPPTTPLALTDFDLHLGKPGSVEQEFALLSAHKITHIICRNSGGQAAYTKIAAARLLNLPVIMIEQSPSATNVTSFDTLLEKIFAFLL